MGIKEEKEMNSETTADLCETCENNFSTCPARKRQEEFEFGDGDDNYDVVSCKYYKKKESKNDR